MRAASRFLLLLLIGLATAPLMAREVYRIRLTNDRGGKIEVSLDYGRHYRQIGKVLLPASRANTHMYTAATFARPKRVVATAVNAIHIGLPDSSGKKVAAIFSLLPKQFYAPPKDYNSYLNTASSLITNIWAGRGIFGGGFAPFVGNKVYLGSRRHPLDRMVKIGETILVRVTIPRSFPTRLEFENRFGGKVTLFRPGRKPKVIAQVLRPVQGIGRFAGTLYTPKGRVRANHTGVIDISTSPVGVVGGFQIIPSVHAMGSDILNARLLTQWMVVGPLTPFEKPLEATYPLFYGALHPDYNPNDLYAPNWKSRLLQRSYVQARIDNGKWQSLPQVVGRNDSAFLHITHLRIWLSQFPKKSSNKTH